MAPSHPDELTTTYGSSFDSYFHYATDYEITIEHYRDQSKGWQLREILEEHFILGDPIFYLEYQDANLQVRFGLIPQPRAPDMLNLPRKVTTFNTFNI